MYVKNIIFGILPHVVVKMENIYQVLWIIQRLCVMRLNFNEKKATYKTQNFYIFICIFINLHNINESCQYSLFSDKILNKTKTFITIFGFTNNNLKEILY